MTSDEIREAMLGFDKVSSDNVEIAVRALESGGAVAQIVAAKPITSGSYLGFMGSSGVRVAWLHVGHLDVIDELAPDGAFPSGVYPGISRVAFAGYSEAAASSAREGRRVAVSGVLQRFALLRVRVKRGRGAAVCRSSVVGDLSGWHRPQSLIGGGR